MPRSGGGFWHAVSVANQRDSRHCPGGFIELMSRLRERGGGVSELRFTFGPGYRVYFTLRDQVVVILLCGGDKQTQSRDIDRAILMAKEL